MNKETRIFLWGLILVIVCGWSLIICIHSMVMEEWEGSFVNWIIFIFCSFGTVSGMSKIDKTTK